MSHMSICVIQTLHIPFLCVIETLNRRKKEDQIRDIQVPSLVFFFDYLVLLSI